MTYTVFSGTLNPTKSINQSRTTFIIRTFLCRYQSESNSSVAVVLRPNRILSSRPQAVRTSRMRSGCCWTLVRLTSNRNENSRTQWDVFGLRSQLQLLTDVTWNQQYTPELQHSPSQHTFVDTRSVQPVAACRQSPISISQLLSLWRHSHYDVLRLRRSRVSQPRSHYDVILIVTSFATELATPTVTDVHYGHLTAFNI